MPRRKRVRVDSYEAQDVQKGITDLKGVLTGASFPVLPPNNLKCGFTC